MNKNCKQEIAKAIISVLKSRFDSFPEATEQTRNAPFHKAFLQAFSEKFDESGTNVDAMISMSSWMHGLNTTLGQSFFENVAHILCSGDKRAFYGTEYRIYSEQERAINEIMTSLKNSDAEPDIDYEDNVLSKCAFGKLIKGTNFTADCYIEDNKSITAIELKSVRPNSGETRGEKQKILKAKAALRIKYPEKSIRYIFGFPFDPTAPKDTEYDKKRFMKNMVEFSKFCNEDEILLADEFWSFLSGEDNTMQELLNLIRIIATPEFLNNFNFINNADNLINHTSEYISIVNKWCLYDEVRIADNISLLKSTNCKRTEKALFIRPFSNYGKYNTNRASTLLESIGE